MDKERRVKIEPVPDNLEQLLSELQLLTIRRIESFGGRLWFVRRPLFQDIVPVVKCAQHTNGDIAVVEEDGSLNMDHGMVFRDD